MYTRKKSIFQNKKKTICKKYQIPRQQPLRTPYRMSCYKLRMKCSNISIIKKPRTQDFNNKQFLQREKKLLFSNNLLVCREEFQNQKHRLDPSNKLVMTKYQEIPLEFPGVISSVKQQLKIATPALTAFCLILISIISFTIRIFSVIKYEAIIHEFDPWFNFRATKYLEEKGMKEFQYWFDSESWYPIGRYVGKTVFPGLMYTTVFFKKLLGWIGLPLDILYICVFCAPFFSIFTCLIGYLITKEVTGKIETGLLTALFISSCPSYLTRSVAGSYDNEAISITLLLLTIYFFVKSIKSGNLLQAAYSAIFYSYLVASWGGYSFVIALFPFYIFVLLLCKMCDQKVYLSYVTFYLIGNMLSMQTQFVEFKIWTKSEHMLSHIVFLILQIKQIYDTAASRLNAQTMRKIIYFFITGCSAVVIAFATYLGFTGKTEFSERVLTLLDPHYARKFIPIVASVSEHQPNQWTNIFFDFHFLIYFQPIGLYFLLKKSTPQKLFFVIYFITAIYFQSLMVRLMLLAFPVLSIIAAIGVSETIHFLLKTEYTRFLKKEEKPKENIEQKIEQKEDKKEDQQIDLPQENKIEKEEQKIQKENKNKKNKKKEKITDTKIEQSENNDQLKDIIKEEKKTNLGIIVDCNFFQITFTGVLLILFGFMLLKMQSHSTTLGSEIYSSPSVILSNRNYETGQKNIIDDFRDSYYWIRKNTPPKSKILSWWDYGYQISGFTNRTVIVDNNTWNFTHIATVGKVFSSNEEEAYEILKDLEVDYVMVLFGGYSGFTGDDINKMNWILRITGNVYPDIKLTDYLVGRLTVGDKIPNALKNSVMYKLCYYRFWETYTNNQKGFDKARKEKIGYANYKLKYFEEVFTSIRWMV